MIKSILGCFKISSANKIILKFFTFASGKLCRQGLWDYELEKRLNDYRLMGHPSSNMKGSSAEGGGLTQEVSEEMNFSI